MKSKFCFKVKVCIHRDKHDICISKQNRNKSDKSSRYFPQFQEKIHLYIFHLGMSNSCYVFLKSNK